MFKILCFVVLSFSSTVWADGDDYQSPEELAAARRHIQHLFEKALDPNAISEQEKQKILEKYKHLDPKALVSKKLLDEAVVYFEINKNKFSNQGHIGILDYKLRSDKPRFFVIDVATGAVSKYYTTHGMGSDRNDDGYAERFSNVPNSWTSSIGYVRTGETYSGKFGRSLRLDGLSATNSKIRERAIVIHGWDWVAEEPVIQGMSLGCAALDWRVKDSVIDRLKEGALLYMAVSP